VDTRVSVLYSSHTDVDEVSSLLECCAALTGKQLLNLMLYLEDEGITIDQNIS